MQCEGNRNFDVTEDFLRIWLAVKIKKLGYKPINYSTVESRCNF